MIWWFALGALLYCTQVFLSYGPLKGSPWFLTVLALSGSLTALTWGLIAKANAGLELYRYAMWWDVMIVLVYLLLPLLFFNVQLSGFGWIGISLMILGVYLVHI